MSSRLHALDALRVYAMLSVMALHASAAYITLPLENFLWAIRDPQTNRFFDGLFCALQGVGMPVFFWMAGFWARKLRSTLGLRGFLVQRARTVLLPFAAASILVLPPAYYVWGAGWARSGVAEWREVVVFKFDGRAANEWLGPAHLWFLEYLLIYLLIAACAGGSSRPPFGARARGFAGLALIGLVITAHPGVLLDFHNTFVPMPFRCFFYGIFFWMGFAAYDDPASLDGLRKRAWFYCAAGSAAFAAFFAMTPGYFSGNLAGLSYPAFMLSEALFVWAMLHGAVGAALRSSSKERRWVSGLAAASLTVYIAHFPMIGLAQVLMAAVPWGPFLKFGLVFASGLGGSLLFWFLCVRRGPLGFIAGAGSGAGPLRPRQATVLAVLLYLAGVGAFQYLADLKLEREYRPIVAGFYRKHFGREPDAEGLAYWTTVAVDKWGLKKVEQIGFIEADEKLRGSRRLLYTADSGDDAWLI